MARFGTREYHFLADHGKVRSELTNKRGPVLTDTAQPSLPGCAEPRMAGHSTIGVAGRP